MLSVCRSITHTTGLFNSSRWRKGMMELLKRWNTTVLVLQQNICISSPQLLLLLLRWSNTNSGLSSICRWDSEDNGENGSSHCPCTHMSLWLSSATTCLLFSAPMTWKIFCALSFFSFPNLFIFFTVLAASIRGLDGNLDILFWMWCLLSRLCSCLTCFILCKKADVL